MADETQPSSSQPWPRPTNEKKLHVVFIHLDLGIGGAEQLVLQLAHAAEKECDIELVTTRCDAHHCFASVAPDGSLHSRLRVRGRWIPQDVFAGRGRALCSTLRLLYLALCIASRRESPPDIIVLDVLPTPLPILQYFTSSALLFYCHFPDQLLTRSPTSTFLTSCYRSCLDGLEAFTMRFADVCCVNSQFTRDTVEKTFGLSQSDLPVLYPALDTSALPSEDERKAPEKTNQIVSLNRYERKKNLGLLIQAAAWLQDQGVSSPKIVIAGGYDTKNVENVEYRAELGNLADELDVKVTFLLSISDQERCELLQTALCVVYTPSGEHFGIVPLEAMFCRTPVVAVRDGGPMETIAHEKTGFLCQPTAASFGQALQTYITNPQVAHRMGRAGRQHVLDNFGPERLHSDFATLMNLAYRKRGERLQSPGYRLVRSLVYICEAAVVLIMCWILTALLRRVGWLADSESLLGGIKKLRNEEL